MTMLGFNVHVQMTRETDDKDPVELPVELEVDAEAIWIYISKEDLLAALEQEE